jgi:hypothetical protein
MFENFQSGDYGKELAKSHLSQHINLIKTKVADSMVLQEPSKDQDSLFKGYDGKEEYNQYLSKRRGELKKDIPLYKMINTDLKLVNEFDLVKDEERVFKDLSEGQEFDLTDMVKSVHKKEVEQMPAHEMWVNEYNQAVLLKTIDIFISLYKKHIEDKMDEVKEDELNEEDLKKSLIESGLSEEAAIVTATSLYKSAFEGQEGPLDGLVKKYMGFAKVEAAARRGGASNPAAVAASVGRKKYGKKKFQEAAAEGHSMKGESPKK